MVLVIVPIQEVELLQSPLNLLLDVGVDPVDGQRRIESFSFLSLSVFSMLVYLWAHVCVQ